MAKKKDQITSVAGLVFKSVWLVIAVILFITGMLGFLRDKSFGMWMAWGFCCLIPMLGNVIRDIIVSGNRGARRGANTYTASVDSTGVTVSNHPFREALIEIVATILASLLLGPIALGFKMLVTVIQIVSFSVTLAKSKKAKE